MRHIPPVLAFIAVFLFCNSSFSQVAINSTGANPDPSAVLDVSAPDKGLLIPRVTLVSATNNTSPVNNPAVGLLVYNIDGTNLIPGFYMWSGTQWSAMATIDQVQSVVHGPESAGIYGELYEYNPIGAYSSLTIPSGGTYVAWSTGTVSNISSMNSNTSSLIVQISGTYSVSFNSSAQLAAGGKIVEAALFVNGIRQDDMHARAWFKEGSKTGDLSFSGIIDLQENDTIRVHFTMDDNGVIRIEIANLSLERLN